MLVDVTNCAVKSQARLIRVVDNDLHDFALVRAKREAVWLVVEQMNGFDVWIGDVPYQTIVQLTLALRVVGLKSTMSRDGTSLLVIFKWGGAFFLLSELIKIKIKINKPP